MSRRGENIFKRKDGRWEGRYVADRSADGNDVDITSLAEKKRIKYLLIKLNLNE